MSERERNGKVVYFTDAQPAQPATGGGDGGSDDAWRARVDGRLANLERDVAVLVERSKHLATKADVTGALLKMLLWMLGGAATLAIIILTAIKLFVAP